MVREASELDLEPGEWPVCLVIEGVMCWRGKAEFHNGELVSYKYGNIAGTIVFTVLND